MNAGAQLVGSRVGAEKWCPSPARDKSLKRARGCKRIGDRRQMLSGGIVAARAPQREDEQRIGLGVHQAAALDREAGRPQEGMTPREEGRGIQGL